MTITSLDTRDEITRKQEIISHFSSLIAKFMTAIKDYHETRKASRARSFYQHHDAQKLESARRDVNRVWQGRV
ncbi:MAG: hypothetical protein V3U96_08420 [Paracoccaceae bacterium]